MSTQEQDLERAKTELLEVIKEMTDKMKVLFKENFVILNKNLIPELSEADYGEDLANITATLVLLLNGTVIAPLKDFGLKAA